MRITLAEARTSVVLKGSSTVAQDYAAQLVIARTMGTCHVPHCRLVEYTDPLWVRTNTAQIMDIGA